MWLALMGGVTAFAAVVIFMQLQASGSAEGTAGGTEVGPEVKQWALVATPIIAVLSPGLALLARHLMRQIPGDPGQIWMSSTIGCGAFLEGGALLAVVLAFISHSPVPLAAVAFVLGVMAVLTPTPGRFAEWTESVSR